MALKVMLCKRRKGGGKEVDEEKASVSFFVIFALSPWHLHGQIHTARDACASALVEWLWGSQVERAGGKEGSSTS